VFPFLKKIPRQEEGRVTTRRLKAEGAELKILLLELRPVRYGAIRKASASSRLHDSSSGKKLIAIEGDLTELFRCDFTVHLACQCKVGEKEM